MAHVKNLTRTQKERLTRLKFKNIDQYKLVEDNNNKDYFIIINTSTGKEEQILRKGKR